MYIGKQPIVGNFQVCDAISVVNGQAAYTMQVSSTNVSPESANHMLVSLNGILQKPGSSFTISGSTITFASNLATGDVIDFVILLGNVLDLGTPSDGTVTAAKVANDLISGKTALASEPADTDEFLVSDAGTLKRIDYSLIKGGTNTPNFRVRLNSNQSISNTTWTKVSWDTEDWDSDTAFASNKFTVPSGQAGKYLFYASVSLDSVDDSLIGYTRIYKNGSAIDIGRGTESWGSNNKSISVPGLWMEDASESDYYEIYAYHDNGDTRNIESTYSYFGGFKIS